MVHCATTIDRTVKKMAEKRGRPLSTQRFDRERQRRRRERQRVANSTPGLITNRSRKAKEIITLSQAPREVVDPTLPRLALRVQDLTIAQDAHEPCLQQETLNIDDSASICDKSRAIVTKEKLFLPLWISSRPITAKSHGQTLLSQYDPSYKQEVSLT